MAADDVDLAAALEQFDRVLANVELLENIWTRFALHIPDSITFGLDTDETEQLRREFAHIVASLPTIDGVRLEAELPVFDDVAQMRLDYTEIDMVVDGYRHIDEYTQAPKRAIGDYKFSVTKLRRRIIRRRIEYVVGVVDECLSGTSHSDEGRQFSEDVDNWPILQNALDEIERLRGQDSLQHTRIGDLRRHIFFAQPHDLRDIVELDWPSVRRALVDIVFEGEPVDVAVEDLGALVRAEPEGSVSSRLAWSQLTPDGFERLVFDLTRLTNMYENVEWCMETNAPDRGRDISADRIIVDELSGTQRVPALIQCKHWTNKSVNVDDLASLLEKVRLWSRRFAVVIVATSGRFTQDAVDWRERRQHDGEFPSVEFWPNSHLEHLLASRPALRARHFRHES